MVTSLPSIPPTFALGVRDCPEHVPWERGKRNPDRQREPGITSVRIAKGGTEVWMNVNQEPAPLPDGSTLSPDSLPLRR